MKKYIIIIVVLGVAWVAKGLLKNNDGKEASAVSHVKVCGEDCPLHNKPYEMFGRFENE